MNTGRTVNEMKADTICSLGVVGVTIFIAAASIYQLFTAWRTSLRSKTADELLTAILRDKVCAGRYFFASVMLLAVFAGIKALLLLAGSFLNAPITLAAFGSAEGGSLPGHFGLCGLLVAALGIYAGFRYLRAAHYVQILFAFRRELGLEKRF